MHTNWYHDFSGAAQDAPVTQTCLGCICEAISGCNRTSTCTGDVCGLFRLTWAYWADAGKPTIAGESPTAGTGIFISLSIFKLILFFLFLFLFHAVDFQCNETICPRNSANFMCLTCTQPSSLWKQATACDLFVDIRSHTDWLHFINVLFLFPTIFLKLIPTVLMMHSALQVPFKVTWRGNTFDVIYC